MTQLKRCVPVAIESSVCGKWRRYGFIWTQKQSRGKTLGPGFKLSHIWGDVEGGSIGTRPHVRVCILFKALFFFYPEWDQQRSEDKTVKCVKQMYIFVSLKAALVRLPPNCTRLMWGKTDHLVCVHNIHFVLVCHLWELPIWSQSISLWCHRGLLSRDVGPADGAPW